LWAGAFILHRTKTGRYTLAIGGNEQAAVLSGIDVALHKTVVYALMGLLAAVGALIVTARLNTAEPLAGSMFELDAIAATVMGGTSLAGGAAKIGGTVVAALILGVLRNGLTLLNIQSAYQQVAIGLVIVVAVLADRFRERGAE
jgi:ribose/xylose/arabinose/galactoside ABC-type transport system permease subunit